jgi:hypothetical protein
MTTLKTLHKQISKEQKRIEMLKNTKNISGSADFYDFINSEIKQAKQKIAEYKIQFDAEYDLQNS